MRTSATRTKRKRKLRRMVSNALRASHNSPLSSEHSKAQTRMKCVRVSSMTCSMETSHNAKSFVTVAHGLCCDHDGVQLCALRYARNGRGEHAGFVCGHPGRGRLGPQP